MQREIYSFRQEEKQWKTWEREEGDKKRNRQGYRKRKHSDGETETDKEGKRKMGIQHSKNSEKSLDRMYDGQNKMQQHTCTVISCIHPKQNKIPPTEIKRQD